MQVETMIQYIKEVLENIPADWLNLTTHRLDIYEEKLAKTQFLEQFEILFNSRNSSLLALSALPTAYDYIRLGHPLSCVLEWAIAQSNHTNPEKVISFSSQVTPILAILRKNHFDGKKTQIVYNDELPRHFNAEIIRQVYEYSFDLRPIGETDEISDFDGSTILIAADDAWNPIALNSNIDFYISLKDHLGSVLIINGAQNSAYISDIQHVRRRETIAMTPANCYTALQSMMNNSSVDASDHHVENNKNLVLDTIQKITNTSTTPLVGSSGLSIQYAILMGLINDAKEKHPTKAIKLVVPPNCYGGTNDQARRVAACIDNVEVVDLPVDGGNDMVEGINLVLDRLAQENAIPYIIAEIPTNPRVEVPDLHNLKDALCRARKTPQGALAIDPVFILDQTFCPNIQFLGDEDILSGVRTISFASGSKFPSGGLCTAGYCVGNKRSESLMNKIALHLNLCDNEATPLQYEILAKQIPSMNQRIEDAYKNTRAFVDFIHKTLPTAKINFVSEALAKEGFTPSVFSLDLPTKGNTEEEKEAYKRSMNHTLINLMITKIPHESKYCVSYGQLKGCYWTIPATSTQGTTKEDDKDYIARVALSPNMDLELHKKVFMEFVEGM